jgi:hypothetical protein
MKEQLKELAVQAGLKIEDGAEWVFVVHKDFFEKFSALVRQDEREQLRNRTQHEQQLMDGQASLLKGKRK